MLVYDSYQVASPEPLGQITVAEHCLLTFDITNYLGRWPRLASA